MDNAGSSPPQNPWNPKAYFAMKIILVPALLILTIAGGATIYSKFFGGESQPTFRVAPVKRGDLSISIGASGVVQPEEVVDVGAQVAGRIATLGADPRGETDSQYKEKTVDFNTPVKEGMLLATIDDAVYRAVRDQNKASLDRAKADLLQMQAKLDQAEQDWKRAERLYDMKSPVSEAMASRDKRTLGLDLSSIKGISESDYDLAKANYEVAKANVEVGKSVIEQSTATLQMAETNLGYTIIKSPVNGTVIARRVNIGQTVVASLNAPSLFLIAKDLRKMQVWASVNEADIGRVKEGMPVHFTVDKVPDEVFHGRVFQIRLNATMTQNVVTYTVVISAENPDLKLYPYLTADVDFEIDNRTDVLLVPNAALVWQPSPNLIAPDVRDSIQSASGGRRRRDPAAQSQGEGGQGQRAQGQRGQGQAQTADGERPSQKTPRTRKEKHYVWTKDGDFVRPIEVQVGVSDGTTTEVSGGEDLKEGLEVITGEVKVAAAGRGGGDTQNPFAPQILRGGRRGGG
jgi:HlyD family secretion protein